MDVGSLGWVEGDDVGVNETRWSNRGDRTGRGWLVEQISGLEEFWKGTGKVVLPLYRPPIHTELQYYYGDYYLYDNATPSHHGSPGVKDRSYH
jgi:hypothetical protein